MWEYNYNYGEYLQHGFLSNARNAAHKYIDKIKSKTGKWIYIYKDNQAKKKYNKSALDYSKKMTEERRSKEASIAKEVLDSVEKEAGKSYDINRVAELKAKANGESSSKRHNKTVAENYVRETYGITLDKFEKLYKSNKISKLENLKKTKKEQMDAIAERYNELSGGNYIKLQKEQEAAKNNLKNKKAGEERAAIVKAQQEYKKNSLDYSKKMDAERRRKEEEILKENESLKEKNAIDAYNKIAEERGLKKIKSSKNIKIKLNPSNVGNKSYDQLAAIEAYNARANQITNRIQEVRDNNNNNSYRAEEYLKKKNKKKG